MPGHPLLATVGWLYVGNRGPFSKFRRQVRGHQSWNPAFEYQSALGATLGPLGVRRIAWCASRDPCEGSRRLLADGAWCRGDCFFLRDGERIHELEGGGTKGKRPL